jgi:hypothetical protein
VILVDTSAWIDLLRARPTAPAKRLRGALDREEKFAILPVILQELLQGSADADEFRALDEYLSSQPMVVIPDPVALHRRAARLYFDCRRKGITIRSSTDCLIAQTAIDQNLPLLHNDRDFDAIARVQPKLRIH